MVHLMSTNAKEDIVEVVRIVDHVGRRPWSDRWITGRSGPVAAELSDTKSLWPKVASGTPLP